MVTEADAALHRQAPMPSGTEASAWAQVVAVVAEKTGYPAELLEPGQALEEDLGIDSLKRVEILSALAEVSQLRTSISLKPLRRFKKSYYIMICCQNGHLSSMRR